MRRAPCQSRSSSQTWSCGRTCGCRARTSSSRPCSAAALSVPAAPHGMASSDRVSTLFRGNSRTAGQAAESSAVPADPNAARFAGVSGTRSSDPSAECTDSGRDRPVTRDCPGRAACSPRAAASTAACSSSSGAGPSAFRQSRQARSDAGRHGFDHGTSARSPASAAITPPGRASGICDCSTSTRIMNAAVSSRSRSPFANLPSSTARPAIPSITPGPACASSHSSSGPSVACEHGVPSARTCPFLVTTAGATATTFRNTAGSPVRIASVPATASADRSPPPGKAPFFSGETRSASRTATVTSAGRSPSSAKTQTERPEAG